MTATCRSGYLRLPRFPRRAYLALISQRNHAMAGERVDRMTITAGVNANNFEPDYRLALDTAGAAKVTGLSEHWLAQLRSKKLGPKWLKVGKRALYRPADLEAWLAEHLQQPKATPE